MIYTIIGILVLIADFASKWAVKSFMRPGQKIDIISGVLSLTYIRNKGMAWGLLQNQRWLFITVTVVVIAVILAIIIKYGSVHPICNTGVALMLSGAVGNLIDRIFYPEGVIDFICADFIDFPIFNIADCAVCVGAALIMIYIIFFDKNKKED